MPAPIAPWMSASEALTIWMLSTAMKAPSVAPITAIQVFAETAGAARRGWTRTLADALTAVECGHRSPLLTGRMHWRSFDNRGKRKDCPQA